MALVITKGTPAIVWGTANTLNSAAANGVGGSIIDSLQITPKNAEPIEIEGNDGTTSVEVILTDGFNAKASLVYDSSKVYPVEGANCTLALTYAASGLFGVSSGNQSVYSNGTTTYTCLVVSVSPAYAKKKEMMVDVALTYRPNVTL